MKTITKLEGTPLSEKEVAEKFQVDTDLRYPDKLETSAYEGQQKDPEGNPVILTLYRTFVNWKLKHPLLEEEHLKALRDTSRRDTTSNRIERKDWWGIY